MENKYENYINNISKLMKEYRQKNKLNQEELADSLGYTQKSVSKWEQGLSVPPIEIIFKLRELMKISFDEFFGLRKLSILDNYVNFMNEIYKQRNYAKPVDEIKKNVFDIIYKQIVFDYVENEINPFGFSENMKIVNNLGSIEYIWFRNNGYVWLGDDKYIVSPIFFKEAFITCLYLINKQIKKETDEDEIEDLNEKLEKLIQYKETFKYFL